jgi:cellulose synthase/poly-beta-1,6-N-acetylglucosamine synthase-like glycosyltransferase
MSPLTTVNAAILGYLVATNTFFLVLLVAAAWELRTELLKYRADGRWRLLSSRAAPTVSLLAPAHNEAATIAESVRSMLGLHYPNLEVVVIDDGSADETLQVLIEEFRLVALAPVFRQSLPTKPVTALYRSQTHPSLVVVEKQNGGKADALNAGLNVASGRLACAVDADTLIEPEAIQQMVWPFVTTTDTLAAGGTIRVVNGSQVRGGRVTRIRAPYRGLGGFQIIEYLRAFLLGRLGWNRLGGNLIISGAFGLFDRAAVVDAGGYALRTVGEDMELAVRLRRRAYEVGRPGRVVFVPDPVAWTEAPETLRVLGRQRDRWHRGLADVLWRNRGLAFNPRYRTLGLVGYPYFLLVELLGPVVEAAGLLVLLAGLALGVTDLRFAALFFLGAYGYGLCLSAFSMLLEELSFHRYDTMRDRLILLGWLVVEPLGYRQLTVLWRLRGLVKYLRRRSDWGVMPRRGFGGPSPTPPRTPVPGPG